MKNLRFIKVTTYAGMQYAAGATKEFSDADAANLIACGNAEEAVHAEAPHQKVDHVEPAVAGSDEAPGITIPATLKRRK